MFWPRPSNDRALHKRLIELAGDPAFAQSPQRQAKLAEHSVGLVMEAVAARRWDQALALAASAWRFDLLALIADRMTPEERARMLDAWWTSCDGRIYPYRKQAQRWLVDSGYIGALERPAEAVRLFRGVGDQAHKLGLSWTPDVDIARHFALSSGGRTGHVYETVAHPSLILAGFEGLGPATYVLDPQRLGSVSQVVKLRVDRARV